MQDIKTVVPLGTRVLVVVGGGQQQHVGRVNQRDIPNERAGWLGTWLVWYLVILIKQTSLPNQVSLFSSSVVT